MAWRKLSISCVALHFAVSRRTWVRLISQNVRALFMNYSGYEIVDE
jgi:hypothetical protein